MNHEVEEDLQRVESRNYLQHADKLKHRKLVCPWKNVEEFNQVYNWLFAPAANVESHARALTELRVWSLRRSSHCPAAVLATIVLLELQLKDVHTSHNNNSNNNGNSNNGSRLKREELQTLYASAITRFFNFMSSIMQSGYNMRSMYETAQELGLPSFVVDLRHLCAHGQVLPPLDVLRSTTQQCYLWLHDYYWSAQRMIIADVDASKVRHKEPSPFDANVTQLFALYDSALECYCKGGRDLRTAKRHLHGKRLLQLKEFMSERELTLLRNVFDVIVKELTALVKREVGLKDMTEIYMEAILKMKYFFVVGEKHTSTAEELQCLIQVTQSLFRSLALQGFIDELVVYLLKMAESKVTSEARRNGASFWALQIVNGLVAFRKCKQIYKTQLDQNPKTKDCDLTSLNTNTISKRALKLLKSTGVDLKSTLIFGNSLRRPWVWVFEREFIEQRLEYINPYTAPVIKSLLPLADPPLKPAEMEALTSLIDIQSQEKNIQNCSVEDQRHEMTNGEIIYTVHDLQAKLNDHEDMDISDNDEESTKKYGIWSTLPTDETQDWSICPLGRLPWD